MQVWRRHVIVLLLCFIATLAVKAYVDRVLLGGDATPPAAARDAVTVEAPG